MLEVKTYSVHLNKLTTPIVFGVTPGEIHPEVPTCPELNQFAASAGATGKDGEIVRCATPGGFQAPFVVFAGLGDCNNSQTRTEVLRAAAGSAARLTKYEEIALSFPVTDSQQLLAALEGALLGAYQFDRYLSKKNPVVRTVWIPSQPELSATDQERALTLARSIHDTRDLINASPSTLYPETLAQWMINAAADLPVEIEKWDFEALQKGGFGGLVAVGKGSKRKPLLLKMTYAPETARSHISLVGKGITFDTGGYSLKPPSSMLTMKGDMTGAATVGNTLLAAARLQLPVKVTAWLCLAENMVSGTASHVDDVIIMKNGKSVEITNTDAEGRLVLADGLVMAAAEDPDMLIDVATLTGAQVVALGSRTAGIMGEEKDRYCEAAKACGELAWPCPLPAHLAEDLQSPVADMRNAGSKREGGMCLAGLFLKEFTDNRPWVHVDLAGPGFNENAPWGYTPKGGTGYGLRTLITLLETY